jgi:hypothetical protein
MSKICEQCGKQFPIHVKIDGKKRNLCNRKFCLECSPFGNRNTSKYPIKVILNRVCGETFESECPKHGFTEFVIEKNLKRRCKKCRVECVTKSRQKRKCILVEMFGGECKLCGYNKCQQALQFHHVDPTNKSFGISKGACRKLEELVEEAKKCILLCANCHFEVENNITEII